MRERERQTETEKETEKVNLDRINLCVTRST